MGTTAGIGRRDTFEAIEAGIERAGWTIHRIQGGGFDVSTAICHGGKSPKKLGIFPRDDGGFYAKCRTDGCRGREFYDTIRRVAQITGSPTGAPASPTGASPTASPAGPSKGIARPNYHQKLWRESTPIPITQEHPARRWMAARNLYQPGLPAPGALRWLDAAGRWPQHEGAGAVVCLYASPERWAAAWLKLPPCEAVELLNVDADGNAALDRPEAEGGERKRAHGSRKGTLCILGDPRAHTARHLTLTEGVADALALASRYMATPAAFGGGGVAGAEATLAAWCATWTSVTLWADRDVAGVRKGWELTDAFEKASLTLSVRLLTAHKDAAAAAAYSPLTTLDMDLVRELTRDLQGLDGLPQWEAARLASLTT